MDSDDKKGVLACASDIVQRITAIETTLKEHISREEKTQREIKWVSRFVFVTLVGILVQQVMS